MQTLKKRIESLQSDVAQSMEQLDLTRKKQELTDLDSRVAVPEIWHNPSRAQELIKQASSLRSQVEPWELLYAQISDIVELMAMGDQSMKAEFEGQVAALESEFTDRKKELLFDGEYDSGNAILRITSGAGGTDAQDWTEMLERMYLRWAEKSGLDIKNVERSTGEEAGIKTSVMEVSGPFTYGRLRSEHGVHRLVRLSPFNSDNLRQTSFALVEVLPVVDSPEKVQIESSDLKIDVYRSGGKGGQSVNTTDSAVRITHVPTGIVVAIQNERSQIQNKETALKILRSKLVAMQLEQQADKVTDLRAGESANWGSQIRNYVLHPYTMVKDTRTKHEDRDTQGVLDGKIDGFIEAYLESMSSAGK